MYTLYLRKNPNQSEIKSTDFGSQAIDLLFMTLECSVRLRVMDDSFGNFDIFKSRSDELQKILCEKGDLILFRSDKRGETAKAFNALAETVAWLSLCPGGVNFLGWNWASIKDGQICDENVNPLMLDIALKLSIRQKHLKEGFERVERSLK